MQRSRVVSKRGIVLLVAVKIASRGAVHKTTEASSARLVKMDHHPDLLGLGYQPEGYRLAVHSVPLGRAGS